MNLLLLDTYSPSRTTADTPWPVLKPENDLEDEVRVNRKMLECAVGALNNLCPQLEFLVFPSGTKVSGASHDNQRTEKTQQ